MSDKDFKVKNKLQVKGITSAGPVVSDASGNIDSTAYIATQYGGTGTSTSPNAGEILYSASGTTYAPASTSVVYPSQTGNSGKYITTDGTSVSWAALPIDTFIINYIDGTTSAINPNNIYNAGSSSTNSWDYTIDAGASVVSF